MAGVLGVGVGSIFDINSDMSKVLLVSTIICGFIGGSTVDCVIFSGFTVFWVYGLIVGWV